MVATNAETFSRRLSMALDRIGYIKGRGRRVALARDLEVTGEAARKWLSGLSIPAMDKAISLAVLAQVDVDWLLTGRERRRPELDEKPSISEVLAAYSIESQRSTHALRHILTMAGTGKLSPADVELLERTAERLAREPADSP